VKKNIFVFPCGSEVALEIFRSLEYSTHFYLIGGSSVDDHGRFIFNDYIDGIPFVGNPDFIKVIKRIVSTRNIDAIYPAMDSVLHILKLHESELGCRVVSSPVETTEICLSKKRTYSHLEKLLNTPRQYANLEEVDQYPVFLKPDVGYGSRNCLLASTKKDAEFHLEKYQKCLILEYLPGKEYTVDCFTNFKGEFLFAGARERKRISNGISVNSKTMPPENRFQKIAHVINNNLHLNGAWFFQVKERANGDLVLMEVASRLGGSSITYRAKGINFASLSVYNAFEIPVSILENSFEVEIDRALDSVVNVDCYFDSVYIDFDDTLIVNGRVNTVLIGKVFEYMNLGKKVFLLTKHDGDLLKALEIYHLSGIFEEVIHIKTYEEKWQYIKNPNSIFIDDSFQERKDVFSHLGIPVFAPDFLP